MIRTINSVRSWTHVHGVRFSQGLSRGAAAWARHLISAGVLAHSGGAMRRHEGEVIEWHIGCKASIEKVVQEWMNSPEHRPVLLAGDYRVAGAGRAIGWMNGHRSTIWVVRFAR
jgi:uncharacterized protein YkwD